MKTLILTVLTLAASSLLAQDTTPAPDLAAKCAEQGGCITLTRDELIAVAQAVADKAYRQGLRACNTDI